MVLLNLHLRKFGDALPHTCKGATSNDLLLISAPLLPLLKRAWVDTQSHLFHAPFFMELHLPQTRLTFQAWRMPESWVEFQPQTDKVEMAYAAHRGSVQQTIAAAASQDDVSKAFGGWAKAWEASVHQALKWQNEADSVRFPSAGLPKKVWTVCSADASQMPYPAANEGGPPWHETGQANCDPPPRPPQSYPHLWLHQPFPAPVFHQLRNEWIAILRAPGYGIGFAQWILRVQCTISLSHISVWRSTLRALKPRATQRYLSNSLTVCWPVSWQFSKKSGYTASPLTFFRPMWHASPSELTRGHGTPTAHNHAVVSVESPAEASSYLCYVQLLGAPSDILQVWEQSLPRITQRPRFGSHLRTALPSSTGMPEGNPMSVACQGCHGMVDPRSHYC